MGRISAFAFHCTGSAVLYCTRTVSVRAARGFWWDLFAAYADELYLEAERTARIQIQTQQITVLYTVCRSHWRRRRLLMRARKTKKISYFWSIIDTHWVLWIGVCCSPSSCALPYNTRSPHNNSRMSVLLASGSVLLASGLWNTQRALHFKKDEYCTVYKQRTRLLKANSKVKS